MLIIEPGLGGGVSKHVRDLIELLHDAVDFFLLAPNRGGLLCLSKPAPDSLPVLYFRAPTNSTPCLIFWRVAGIERVHYHHTVRLDSEILKIPQKLGLPYDYTVHDYYSFCPQVMLTTTFLRYCGEPSEPGLRQMLADTTDPDQSQSSTGDRDIARSWSGLIGFSYPR